MALTRSRFLAAAAMAAMTAGTLIGIGPAAQAGGGHKTKPTVVLVHGAFADSSSWNGTVRRLLRDGYPVVSAANPLRGVASDATQVKALLDSIKGPIVMVGHSYGGMVISRAAAGDKDVKALVYVAAFAPLAGESAADLSGRYPGSTLAETLRPVPLPGGQQDLYVDLIPEADKNIPAAAQRFEADRADARAVRNVEGGSHAFFVAEPDLTATFIEKAAARS